MSASCVTIVLVLVSGCAHTPTAAPVDLGHATVQALVGQPAREQAIVQKIGPYQRVPGRDVYSPEPTAPFPVQAAADTGAVVFVMRDEGPYRVVIGVRREDLATRLAAETALAPAPGLTWEGASVVLHAGAAPQVGAQEGDWVHLTATGDGLSVEGWAHRPAWSVTWRPPTWPTEGEMAHLAHVDDPEYSFAELIRAADGAVVATLVANAPLVLQRLDGDRITAFTPWINVTGRLRPALVGSDPPAPSLAGLRAPPEGDVELAAGVWLTDPDTGWRFGRVDDDVRVQLQNNTTPGAATHIWLPTPWGLMGVVARCGSVREGALPRCEP